METSLRIITTTIILLWSIQTYKCTEGFKPGKQHGESERNEKVFILFPTLTPESCYQVGNELKTFSSANFGYDEAVYAGKKCKVTRSCVKM